MLKAENKPITMAMLLIQF